MNEEKNNNNIDNENVSVPQNDDPPIKVFFNDIILCMF